MKKKILFIERQPNEFVSIENVFRQLASNLSTDKFDIAFQQMPFGNDLLGIFKNLLFFKRQDADIYHVTGHIHYIALRLPVDKTVLTIHDLRFLWKRSGLRRFVLKKLFLDWPVSRLRYITAISQKTKDEIVSQTNCDEKKIRVIDNPLTIESLPTETRPFNKTKPVILQIGHTPNKNIPKLISAIAGIECKLVIVGGIDEVLRRQLIENNICFEIKTNLGQAELLKEYHDSDIVTFCSIYEGFGLPIIEAQALNKPVITSDLSPMAEVSGGAAVLVDPYDVSSIRKGILQIIEDDDLRADIIERGRENIKRFDPVRIARMYEIHYENILRD